MDNISKKLLKKLTTTLFDKKIIKIISKYPYVSDEPHSYLYTALLDSTRDKSDGFDVENRAAGNSFYCNTLALLKCLMESVERYSTTCYRKKSLIYESFNNLKETAIDPSLYTDQKDVKNLPLGWVWGNDLFKNTSVLIPAQAVYYSYQLLKNEPLITQLNSTGAAAGFDLLSSLTRGLYEAIEHESYMTVYLAKIPVAKIDLNYAIKDFTSATQEKIIKISKVYKRYKLDLSVFDLTSDFSIPCFGAFLIDKSGLGTALSVGLKCSLDPQVALLGAIEESSATRPYIKSFMTDLGKKDPKIIPERIATFRDRGLYWSSPNMLSFLGFLLNQPKKRIRYQPTNLSLKQQLKEALKRIKEKKFDVFFVDLTPKNLAGLNLKVIKIIIPQMQPMLLFETFKQIRLERIRSIASHHKHPNYQINSIPHPYF